MPRVDWNAFKPGIDLGTRYEPQRHESRRSDSRSRQRAPEEGGASGGVAPEGHRSRTHVVLLRAQLDEQNLLPRMSEIAEAMLRDALQACVTDSLGTAQAVLERDDTLDSFRDQVNRRLVDVMTHNPSKVSSALELMLIGRHLERVGDHATNIAEDVFFVVVGEDVRHQVVDFTDPNDKQPGALS